MPIALQVDWNLIRELYTQGLKPKDISAKTGVKESTLTSRASRAGWKVTALKAKSMVQEGITEREDDSKGLAKASQRVRSGLASVLERSIDRLEQLTIKTPQAALKANAELESVVRNCKTVFGWSEGSQAPAVRIGILLDAQVHTEPQALPMPDPTAIDVESVKVNDNAT